MRVKIDIVLYYLYPTNEKVGSYQRVRNSVAKHLSNISLDFKNANEFDSTISEHISSAKGNDISDLEDACLQPHGVQAGSNKEYFHILNEDSVNPINESNSAVSHSFNQSFGVLNPLLLMAAFSRTLPLLLIDAFSRV